MKQLLRASRQHCGALRPWTPALLAVCGAVLVAAWGTWPLAAHLSGSVYDPRGGSRFPDWAIRPDIYLTTWILAWDTHALATAPLSLFHANIYHPASLSLATTEHLLGALPLYLPLALCSRNPVFAHQATLLLTFACAFLAELALVRDWTGSWPAAILAGILFAFSPVRASNLGALHIEGNFYLPLIALCAHRAVADPKPRWPVLLAIVLGLQGLYSFQVGYVAFVATAVLSATVLVFDPAARRHWLRLILPVAGATLPVAISALPYLATRDFGVVPIQSLDFLRAWSAQLGETGVTTFTLLLAALGVPFWRWGLRRAVTQAWPVALVATAVSVNLLALGPELTIAGHTFRGPYTLLWSIVPGFSSVRFPLRFLSIVTMPVAALAGITVAGVLNWLRAREHARVSAILAFATIGFAAWSVHGFMGGQPVPLRPIETAETLPAAYRWLATAPPGAVLELPFRNWDLFVFDREIEALRVYRSTYHWHPLVNGYSGYAPPTYGLLAAMAARLPDAVAIRDLAHLAGVRYVVTEGSPTPEWQRAGVATLRLTDSTVYILPDATLEDPPLAHPLSEWHGRTPNGVPLEPLGRDGQHAVLSDPSLPGFIASGFFHTGSVVVANKSDRAWPGIALPGTHGVGLTARVRDAAGRVILGESTRTPLGVDVAPGEKALVPVWFRAAVPPGPYSLEIALAQDGVSQFDPALGGTLNVPMTVRQFH